MAVDPVRRIENRRRIIGTLRYEARRLEQEARDLRARADRMEASTDALEQSRG